MARDVRFLAIVKDCESKRKLEDLTAICCYAFGFYAKSCASMCGIVGLIGTPDAAREAFLGLTTLQHRGQDAAGILSYDTDGFHRVKNLGLVESVFTRDNMTSLTGDMAIGHARYSTIGRGELFDVQPFLLSYPFGLGM